MTTALEGPRPYTSHAVSSRLTHAAQSCSIRSGVGGTCGISFLGSHGRASLRGPSWSSLFVCVEGCFFKRGRRRTLRVLILSNLPGV